jgi:hypothetical protein
MQIKSMIDSLHKAPEAPTVFHKQETPEAPTVSATENPHIAKIDKIIDQEEKTADAIVTEVLSRRSERLSLKPNIQYKTSRKNKGKQQGKRRSRNSRTM